MVFFADIIVTKLLSTPIVTLLKSHSDSALLPFLRCLTLSADTRLIIVVLCKLLASGHLSHFHSSDATLARIRIRTRRQNALLTLRIA